MLQTINNIYPKHSNEVADNVSTEKTQRSMRQRVGAGFLL